MSDQERENPGLRLLEKGKQGILRTVFSRTGLVSVLLLLNFVLLFAAFFWLKDFLPHILGGSALFTVFMVLILINSSLDPSAKLTWLVLIMLLPVFGSILYWYTRQDVGHRALRRRVLELTDESRHALRQEPKVAQALEQADAGAAALCRYVRQSGCYNVYASTRVTYFSQGEEKFQALLEELEKAERFIFLEYFIIDEGIMWGKILEILARKAKQGVDVRVIYDGTCEFMLLPKSYPKKLARLGIRCKVFSSVAPFVSTHYNYRDHRKILVIDGHTAFNGGVNLADEYINAIERYGHWKDTAIMLKGAAVESFTRMFLQMWDIDEKKPQDHGAFLLPPPAVAAEGFVMPFGECPLDDRRVGQRLYMDILNRAKRYVHIMTPYLILDAEMENTLKYAAERGVEVSLILPGIPDKKVAFALAKSHYKSLVDSGVRIYEYTPGFVHAKVFVSDDREAVVGTINLDYRSLYHHFECATYLHGVPCIADIETDFQKTRKKCRRVNRGTVKNEKWYYKLGGFLLKVFAPLL